MILLYTVGPTIYNFLKMLVSPAKLTDHSFDEIVEKARAYFNPKLSPIVKRSEFNTRCQGEGESVATYVADDSGVARRWLMVGHDIAYGRANFAGSHGHKACPKGAGSGGMFSQKNLEFEIVFGAF